MEWYTFEETLEKLTDVKSRKKWAKKKDNCTLTVEGVEGSFKKCHIRGTEVKKIKLALEGEDRTTETIKCEEKTLTSQAEYKKMVNKRKSGRRRLISEGRGRGRETFRSRKALLT